MPESVSEIPLLPMISSAFKTVASLSMILAFSSCGSMDSIKTTTASGVDKVGQGFGKVGEGFGKVGDLAMSPFRPGVPVVEARESDLKSLPNGEEQAIAYQQKNRGFWGFFGGPVDFEEPSLPEDGGAMDGGLLPPLE